MSLRRPIVKSSSYRFFYFLRTYRHKSSLLSPRKPRHQPATPSSPSNSRPPSNIHSPGKTPPAASERPNFKASTDLRPPIKHLPQQTQGWYKTILNQSDELKTAASPGRRVRTGKMRSRRGCGRGSVLNVRDRVRSPKAMKQITRYHAPLYHAPPILPHSNKHPSPPTSYHAMTSPSVWSVPPYR